ncbi:16S rRNA (cytosine(967)-C(5))-methyltransferase RsmB [soil metagenome]
MKISPARVAAFDVLLEIERKKAFSSGLLPVAEDELSLEDRGLCHELVLGTLRKQIYLDRLISAVTKNRKIDDEVRIALRLAIYQIRFLDRIPFHSAVNESVNLVHRAKKTSAKPFVNAILRRLLREPTEIEFSDDLDRLSVETSHPRWLLEKWAVDFGLDDAERIANANNIVPLAAFRVIDGDPVLKEEVEKFARRSENVDGCYLADVREHRLGSLGREGRIYFQDEASQLVANSIEIGDRRSIFDVCASPGGKTGILARHASAKAGIVIAGDISSPRVDLLKESLSRQDVNLHGIVQYDATVHLPFVERSFDHVLVDAPCSGTGTIRHNPELRYFVKPDDLSSFAHKQLSILISASEMVRPGGQIVYSTCSLEIEENEDVCKKFLGLSDDFEAVASKVSSVFLTDDGFARTRPDRDGMDGFFIACFRRKLSSAGYS